MLFFFYIYNYWIQLTFPHISPMAFDIKAKGTSAGTFFTVAESELKRGNNKEGTARLFNVQIQRAVASVADDSVCKHHQNSVSPKLTRRSRGSHSSYLLTSTSSLWVTKTKIYLFAERDKTLPFGASSPYVLVSEVLREEARPLRFLSMGDLSQSHGSKTRRNTL